MVTNPTDTKEYPAPENCEKCNQSLLEIQGKSKAGTRSEKKYFWVHVAVTPNFSHFSFHNKRGSKGMIAGGILPNFKGTAV